MEVKIFLSGVGAAIPKTGLGINAATVCALQVRENLAAPQKIYQMYECLTLGDSNGSFVFGYAITDWLTVPEANAHLFLLENLVGKEIDIEVSGTSIFKSKCDITLRIINKDNDPITALEKLSVPVDSIQLASTRIRGRLKNVPHSAGKISPAK